jgi:hypothetical protein
MRRKRPCWRYIYILHAPSHSNHLVLGPGLKNVARESAMWPQNISPERAHISKLLATAA